MRCPSPLPPTLHLSCPSPPQEEESVWATRTRSARGLAVSRTARGISKRCARERTGKAIMPGARSPDQQEGWRDSGQSMALARWVLHRRDEATERVRRRCRCRSARAITCSRHSHGCSRGPARGEAWLPVVVMAWRQPKREEFSCLVHEALWCEASATAHGGLSPCRYGLAVLYVTMRCLSHAARGVGPIQATTPVQQP